MENLQKILSSISGAFSIRTQIALNGFLCLLGMLYLAHSPIVIWYSYSSIYNALVNYRWSDVVFIDTYLPPFMTFLASLLASEAGPMESFALATGQIDNWLGAAICTFLSLTVLIYRHRLQQGLHSILNSCAIICLVSFVGIFWFTIVHILVPAVKDDKQMLITKNPAEAFSSYANTPIIFELLIENIEDYNGFVRLVSEVNATNLFISTSSLASLDRIGKKAEFFETIRAFCY